MCIECPKIQTQGGGAAPPIMFVEVPNTYIDYIDYIHTYIHMSPKVAGTNERLQSQKAKKPPAREEVEKQRMQKADRNTHKPTKESQKPNSRKATHPKKKEEISKTVSLKQALHFETKPWLRDAVGCLSLARNSTTGYHPRLETDPIYFIWAATLASKTGTSQRRQTPSHISKHLPVRVLQCGTTK